MSDWAIFSGGLLFLGGVGLAGPIAAWPAGEGFGFGAAVTAGLLCSVAWLLAAFVMRVRALREEGADRPLAFHAVTALILAALAAQAAGAAIGLTALIPTNPDTELLIGAVAASSAAAGITLAAMLALGVWTRLRLVYAALTPLAALAGAVVMLAAGLFAPFLSPILWIGQGMVAINLLRRRLQIAVVAGLAVWTVAAFSGWFWLYAMDYDARALERLEGVAKDEVISDLNWACVGDDHFWFLRRGRWRITGLAVADGQEPRATVQFYSWMRIPSDTMMLRIGSAERYSGDACVPA